MAVRMVMIKGREIAIEQSTIPTKVLSSDRFVGWSPRPGLFVLRQSWANRLFGGMCAVGCAMLLVVGLLTLMESFAGLILAVPGALFTALGLWIFGPTYHFRLDAGEWSIRYFGRTRRRPLASILAVQVTEGGWFGAGRSFPGQESVSRYFLYQMNVVLDEPNEPRLFVYSYRDPHEILRTGRLLAEFLKVPLVLSDGVAAKTGGEAGRNPAGK